MGSRHRAGVTPATPDRHPRRCFGVGDRLSWPLPSRHAHHVPGSRERSGFLPRRRWASATVWKHLVKPCTARADAHRGHRRPHRWPRFPELWSSAASPASASVSGDGGGALRVHRRRRVDFDARSPPPACHPSWSRTTMLLASATVVAFHFRCVGGLGCRSRYPGGLVLAAPGGSAAPRSSFSATSRLTRRSCSTKRRVNLRDHQSG